MGGLCRGLIFPALTIVPAWLGLVGIRAGAGERWMIMLSLGAYEAMNFDGGGSTAMVVNGKLVNSPSDKTGERAVGSGLLVVLDK